MRSLQTNSTHGLVDGRHLKSLLRCDLSFSRAPQFSRGIFKVPFSKHEYYCPHPDALRRRREAEARHERRMNDLAKMAAEVSGGSIDAPNIIEINSASELERYVSTVSQKNATALVYFKSSSCQMCTRIFPKLRRVSGLNPDLQLLVADVGGADVRRLCGAMGISKIPFFQFYKKGALISQGSWNDIEILKTLAEENNLDGPGCTLSEPHSGMSSGGRWKRVAAEGGITQRQGNERFDVLMNSSALEWIPLEPKSEEE